MNENQKKWLMYLQEKGIEIECRVNSPEEFEKAVEFELDTNKYQFSAQPIPDIPDWRELCREMQSKWVKFENYAGGISHWLFDWNVEEYHIPQQPIPEWREK